MLLNNFLRFLVQCYMQSDVEHLSENEKYCIGRILKQNNDLWTLQCVSLLGMIGHDLYYLQLMEIILYIYNINFLYFPYIYMLRIGTKQRLIMALHFDMLNINATISLMQLAQQAYTSMRYEQTHPAESYYLSDIISNTELL